MDVTSTKRGKSNLPFRENSLLDVHGLVFVPTLASQGVQDVRLGYNRQLVDTVTSYRGKRDTTPSFDSPGDILSYYQEQNSKPKYDTGHSFFSRKESLYVSHRRVTLRGLKGAFYEGPILATVPYDIGQTYTGWGSQSLVSIKPASIDLGKGTTAISRCEPTRSTFSLVRAVVEAVRDFPEIPLKAIRGSKSKGEISQNLGSEYLNVVFGIVPTVQDLVSLATNVVTLGDKIEQFKRDLGRPVRRRYSFPENVVSTKSMQGTSVLHNSYAAYQNPAQAYTAMDSAFYGKDTPYTVSQTESITEKYWFSGAFEYYLDPLLEKLGPAGEAYGLASQFLGLNLSLKTIWELTPWSWLVDWFLNTRDFISLAEKVANDSLVLRYAYLMRTSVLTNEIAIEGLKPVHPNNPTNFTTTTQVIVKERVRGTPYGFGLNTNAFSLQQWAILGALGLTKAPKTLW